jgi:hypothetical protein
MRKQFIYLLISFYLLAWVNTKAQSITLTPNGLKPGFVGAHPRLTWSAIQAIASPEEGDMVGDLTFKCLRVYTDGKWSPITQNTEGPDMTLFASVGSVSFEDINDITTDASGNVYAAGYFQNTCNFSGTSRTAAGNSDLFVCKYTAAGSLLWIYTASTCSADDYANAITLDAAGNAYVTGSYGGSINFGGVSKTTAGTQDVFLIKLNEAGVQQWVQTGGGPNYDQATDIILNQTGDVIITGTLAGSVNFSGTSLNSLAGLDDFFVIKYSSAGALHYIKNGLSSSEDFGSKLAIDNLGNLIVFGSYYQSGQYGFFIAKYDNSASNVLLWTQTSTPSDFTSAAGLGVDNYNDIYITGLFQNTLTVGSTILNTYGSGDIYLLRYDFNGNLNVAKSFGGAGYDYTSDLTFNTNKTNFYLTGSISSDAVFENYNVSTAGPSDGFLAKFDQSAALVYVKTMGGKSIENVKTVHASASGNIYVGGSFNEKSYFGNFEKTSAGNADGFLMLVKE